MHKHRGHGQLAVAMMTKKTCMEPAWFYHLAKCFYHFIFVYVAIPCVLTVLLKCTMQDLVALKADLQKETIAREMKWASGQRGDQRYDAPSAAS